MLRRAAIVVLATAALAAAAGDPVAAIIDEARGDPVEIFADVVFHLLDAGKIPEKERVPLLDEVFLRATDAREAVPERPAAIRPGPAAPIRAQIKLDALSIQGRVVQALLGIDAKHGRELFSRIPRPNVPRTDCKGTILEDPTPYFEIVEAVVVHAPFTAKEQEDRVPFWTMESAIRGIQTSLEITPAARNLAYLVHDEKDALAMVSAFAVALGIDDSDRNFGGAIQANVLGAVLVMADRLAKLGAPPQALQSALRGFLVRHLSAARCADSSADYTGAVAAFNAAVAGQTSVLPITPEENTPAKIEGKAESKPAGYSQFQELADQVNAFSKNPDPSVDVLAAVRAWKGGDGDDPVGVFHRKLSLYFQLMGPFAVNYQDSLDARSPLLVNGRAVPRPALTLQAVMPGLIATLSDAEIVDLSPCDWLEEVRNLLRHMTTHASSKVGGKILSQEVVPPDIAQALASSSLSALQVYGRLEILEHSPPSWLIAPDRK